MPYDPLPALAGLDLDAVAALIAERKLPPVEQWNPARSGESEMLITADGRWFHQGGEITRPAMVRAFSSLLRVDAEGQYWLVTPQEKLKIAVEDAPFQAVELHSEGVAAVRNLAFRLNSDDLVVADKDHVIELRGQLPYLHVRHGLWARISRPVYYELAEIALDEGASPPGIWSHGCFFPIGSDA
jgi:uncharacterized protein